MHAEKGYGGSYAYWCANIEDCWRRIQNNKSAQHRVHLTALRRGLALLILFNVILLVVVLVTIGGR
ncbi:MAG: hypothetical protein J0M11_01365 [Anaerolineae bacterium]|nr:hypothetical protein [Anaerolineae bacterium]